MKRHLHRRVCAWIAAAALGCSGAAQRPDDDEAVAVRPALPPAAQRATRGCRGGDLRACAAVARALRTGNGTERDEPRAAHFAEIACHGGEPSGCVELGLLHVYGRDVLRDPGHAAELFRRACDTGLAAACTELGLLHELGQGVERDVDRAAALFEQACERRDAQGCSHLGWLYAHGVGVGRDPARAAALFEQACGGGWIGGCANLALAYETGQGLPRDPARAALFYERACEGRHPRSCLRLGVLLDRGRGVTRDHARATTLFHRAMDLMLEQGGGLVTSTSIGRTVGVADNGRIERRLDPHDPDATAVVFQVPVDDQILLQINVIPRSRRPNAMLKFVSSARPFRFFRCHQPEFEADGERVALPHTRRTAHPAADSGLAEQIWAVVPTATIARLARAGHLAGRLCQVRFELTAPQMVTLRSFLDVWQVLAAGGGPRTSTGFDDSLGFGHMSGFTTR